MTESSGPSRLAAEDANEIRRITHDINNALEVIVQASYLVNMTQLARTPQSDSLTRRPFVSLGSEAGFQLRRVPASVL